MFVTYVSEIDTLVWTIVKIQLMYAYQQGLNQSIPAFWWNDINLKTFFYICFVILFYVFLLISFFSNCSSFYPIPLMLLYVICLISILCTSTRAKFSLVCDTPIVPSFFWKYIPSIIEKRKAKFMLHCMYILQLINQ